MRDAPRAWAMLEIAGAALLVCAAGLVAAAAAGDRWRLSYLVPDGWVSDSDAARRLSLSVLLHPEGAGPHSAEPVIAIAFHPKHDGPFAFPTLESFFMEHMRGLVSMFPDLVTERWIPESLKKVPLEVASLEIYGTQPGPLRIVLVDAGDGYYSIQVMARQLEDLDRPEVRAFFDSLLFLRAGEGGARGDGLEPGDRDAEGAGMAEGSSQTRGRGPSERLVTGVGEERLP